MKPNVNWIWTCEFTYIVKSELLVALVLMRPSNQTGRHFFAFVSYRLEKSAHHIPLSATQQCITLWSLPLPISARHHAAFASLLLLRRNNINKGQPRQRDPSINQAKTRAFLATRGTEDRRCGSFSVVLMVQSPRDMGVSDPYKDQFKCKIAVREPIKDTLWWCHERSFCVAVVDCCGQFGCALPAIMREWDCLMAVRVLRMLRNCLLFLSS